MCVAKSCPPEAHGKYPNCNCNHFDFEFKNDGCVRKSRDGCPAPAVKIEGQPGCHCPNPADFFDDFYWLCRTRLYLPSTTTTTSHRPYVPCPAYQRGIWPDCEPIPCGLNQLGDFMPNCTYVHVRINVTLCTPPQYGEYPRCQWPCPRHTAREYKGKSESLNQVT